MKKIVVFLLLGFASFALIAGNSSHAADELVDLYPYDQLACLEAANECTYTKVGSSHWTMEYAGHRYHFIRGVDRILSQVSDGDSDGFLDSSDFGALTYNAFAALYINDTDQTAIIETTNARTDITSVVHRMYSYFDENGQLAMFEDHIGTYYIHNDGTLAAPDWRLATETEATAFDDAEDPEVDTPNTRLTHIRMALDDVDTDGYVLEPLKYLTWTNADVDTAVDTNPENWSTIIDGDGVLFDGNPNSVVIPAGWTVVSWGTNDRGTLNAKTATYIHNMPEYMLDGTLDAMAYAYDPQPATFTGITALDDDAVTPGTNIVVEYNDTFDLPTTVSASWLNMYDAEGDIIKSTEKLDYSVVISQDDVDLETIDFTYDELTDEYTASAAVTSIDSSEFSAAYKATWIATTPEADVTEVVADIVIGVMPPRFEDVEDRFIDQSIVIDLLEGITANDGYGNDKTDDIEISYPAGLNPYNPYPGEYEIDLTFTHNVFFPGYDNNSFTLDTTQYMSDLVINEVVTDFRPVVALYTDVTNLKTSTFAWNTTAVIMEVSGDGTLIQSLNRGAWGSSLINETYPASAPGDGSGIFADWISGMTLETDGFVLVVGSGTPAFTQAQTTDFGDSVAYDLDAVPDFSYDIVTETSYTLTVDDTTAPIAMIIDENYSFFAGDFETANAAILANVVAYDFTDGQDDLVQFVSNNGGLNVNTPGTYTVEVTVEDAAGHTDVVEFDVEVKAALLTEADVQALIDANVLTEADIQDLIDASVLTEAAVQALIDAALEEEVPESGCGSAINGTSAIFITFSLILGASALFFFRRRR